MSTVQIKFERNGNVLILNQSGQIKLNREQAISLAKVLYAKFK